MPLKACAYHRKKGDDACFCLAKLRAKFSSSVACAELIYKKFLSGASE